MDWVNQNKFKNWLIAALLIINLLTLSILWMQTTRTNEPQSKEQGPRASESVNLLRKALDLNEEQAKQSDSMRTNQLEQSRSYNDRLAALKRQLSEELFKQHPDTALVDLQAKEIGELQSKVEMIRFNYFKELLAICTPAQKDKLKPIVAELFGRKPPKDEPQVKIPRSDQKEEPPPHEKSIRENGDRPPTPREDKPGPPSVDEKLAKMSEILSLSAEQTQKIRAILSTSMQEGGQLRKRVNPDPNEIQAEKERIRKKEDDAIMKLLDENQKKEFSRTILKRGK